MEGPFMSHRRKILLLESLRFLAHSAIIFLFLAFLVGWGVGVEISQPAAGGHDVRRGHADWGCVNILWRFGPRPVPYLRCGNRDWPPLLGVDVQRTSADDGLASSELRIALWVFMIPLAALAWCSRRAGP